MKFKKFVFTGYGNIVKRHIKIIKKNIPKSIFYIITKNPQKYKSNEKIKIQSLSNYKLDKKIDFFFICSPATTHISYIMKFINFKKKIFVEKPLSHNFNTTQKLKALSDKSKKKIFTGYVFRSSEAAKKIKKVILNKELGEIIKVVVKSSSYLPYWRNNKNFKETVSAQRKLGGGALLELSHEIDYLLWFFKKIKILSSRLIFYKKFKLDVESGVKIKCAINKKTPLQIDLDFHSKQKKRYCEIMGKKKKLTWKLNSNKVEIVDYKKKKKDQFVYSDDMYENQINFFLHKKQFGNSLNKSIKVLEFIEQVRKKSLSK